MANTLRREGEKAPAKTKRARAKAAKPAPAAAPPAANDEPRAPAFGHNQPTHGDVRRWANALIRKDDEGEELKLKVKEWRGQRRDLRKEANASGIVMRELDEAIDELRTEEVDLLARQERLNHYRTALGLPVFGTPEAKEKPKGSLEDEAAAWKKRGAQAGMMGKSRELPDGIPPEHIQSYLKGWDEEQENLMKKSPLTAAAFKPKPEPKAVAKTNGKEKPAEGPAPAPAGPTVANGGVLILKEHHFAAGTPLKEANLKTLLPEHREAFDAAERVVALFGAAKRVLAEPDGEGRYVDTGADDVPFTPIEAAKPEDAAVDERALA